MIACRIDTVNAIAIKTWAKKLTKKTAETFCNEIQSLQIKLKAKPSEEITGGARETNRKKLNFRQRKKKIAIAKAKFRQTSSDEKSCEKYGIHPNIRIKFNFKQDCKLMEKITA